MTQAMLNGELVALDAARISPMDRGFLFGDGIYEVIPSYGGRMVGFSAHMDRLASGLTALSIPNPHGSDAWRGMLEQVIAANGAGNLGVYLQVTRGVVSKRQHRFPESPTPTVFAFAFTIPNPSDGASGSATRVRVTSTRDLRWKRCHIKSTALLGNVLHMMEGVDAGADEVLLFNEHDELTEAAACNVFVVKGDRVATPDLDHQKLPGITRNLLVDMMRRAGDWSIEERAVTRAEVNGADEIWLTSSTKEISPVVSLDGRIVGDGEPGPFWSRAQALFHRHRFDY